MTTVVSLVPVCPFTNSAVEIFVIWVRQCEIIFNVQVLHLSQTHSMYSQQMMLVIGSSSILHENRQLGPFPFSQQDKKAMYKLRALISHALQ